MSPTPAPPHPPEPAPPAPADARPAAPGLASTKRLLNVVLAVGIADLVLFVALLYVAFVDRSDVAVSVLGPLHGAGFLALLALTANGAIAGRWGWWFPAVTLVTTGPPGSIVGDLVLRRRIAEQERLSAAR